MTSVQGKKGIAVEEDRQTVIKQTKVRTKLKKDKSWIHQNSEEDKDDSSSPVSPRLKSLEGRKYLWAPNPESGSDRDSPTFGAKESLSRTSSSSPVQSSNRLSTYSVNETNYSSSSPQPSPPPSVSSEKAPSYRGPSGYIIRGQPINATLPAKSQAPFNGVQKSTATQQKSASLPRGPSTGGYKMTTEEYKKLAPYNTRNKSFGDLSDEETSQTPSEQAKRTEVASSILKNSASKERSYVFSAAKKYTGTSSPTENHTPFLAKKVQVQEEDEHPKKKTDAVPRSEDTSSAKIISSPKLTSRTITETNSSPNKPQYGKYTATKEESPININAPKPKTMTIIETNSNPFKPQYGKVTATKEESPKNISAPKPTSATITETNSSAFKPQYGKVPATKEESPININAPKPKTMTIIETNSSPFKPQYGKVTATKEESVDNKGVPQSSTEYRSTTTRTVPTRTESSPVKVEEDTKKKRESLPKTLAAYLYDDSYRPKDSSSSKLITSSITETSNSEIKPKAGKITVIKDESSDSNVSPKASPDTQSTTTRTVTTRTERVPRKEEKDTSNKDESQSDSLDTYLFEDASRFEKDWKASVPAPAVTPPSSTNNNNDPPKANSYSTTNITETRSHKIQTGPGKITVIRDESSPPKPVPRAETKPKDTSAKPKNVNTSKVPDLISWSDLDNKPKAPETRPIEPSKPAPTITVNEARYRIPELLEEPKPYTSSNRSSSPSGSTTVTTTTRDTYRSTESSTGSTVNETKYRIVDLLDESEPETVSSRSLLESENRSVTIRESNYESSRPSVEVRSERSISPRPVPRAREITNTTVTESSYKVPEILEKNMLESSPASGNIRTTVTTTHSAEPTYSEYLETIESRSVSSRERYSTTTVETSYIPEEEKDAQSSNKGILFLKEYSNTRESLKSPQYSGNQPDFSDDSDRISYSSANYNYSSLPRRGDEGPCNYCGREIKDCAKIILEHLNIYCHEYCFKCGICGKPMGELIDNLFIHRNVVHCESCYEKLF